MAPGGDGEERDLVINKFKNYLKMEKTRDILWLAIWRTFGEQGWRIYRLGQAN